MAAYLLVDCEVTDPARYETYKKLAPAAIAKYGGRIWCAAAAPEDPIEGDWRRRRTARPRVPGCGRAPGASTICPTSA